jgi:hypothetical protein
VSSRTRLPCVFPATRNLLNPTSKASQTQGEKNSPNRSQF